ncbi:MAG: ribosome recycling factor [Chloroflexi bacterium]|nr:ribosome recycling factor [Chloroflexota bacterium]
MVTASLLTEAENRMKKALEAMKREMNNIRTGRATPALIEGVGIDYYGVTTPLNQLGTITAPEARLLVVQPWDRSALPAIEKGILRANLGLNPSSDGVVVRIPIPQPTEERRREYVKMAKRQAEEFKVEVRNIRRDLIEKLRAMEKNKEISQDDNRRSQEHLQRITDSYVSQIDAVATAKEAEVMEV